MKKIIITLSVLLLPLAAQAKKETFTIDTSASTLSWEGKKRVGDDHQGQLQLKSGKMEMDKDNLVGGEFTVDMASLKNTDISNEGMNKKLVSHLKSDDFFSVDKYPTSTLKISKVEKQSDGSYLLHGDLTIKGIKKPISFPAKVTADKNELRATANLTVDRTLYNVRYNSLKFFSTIGDKAIEDTFTVKVDLVAKK